MAAALRGGSKQTRWGSKVKQVTKANFAAELDEIKARIQGCDFVAVSSQRTGSFSDTWRHPLPFDTADIAYRKSKDAAERFELLQFAVCPFTVCGDKVVAYPFNFHLFPRDEFNMGMPSYSFSCQTSSLESMARRGFDFNVCIYDGISYMSRVQEVNAQMRAGKPISCTYPVKSSSSPAVADAVFTERIKSRVRHWRESCKKSNEKTVDGLVSSLRKIILGSEVYGTRPCIKIDICHSRQLQLVLEAVELLYDDLIPLIVPDREGEPTAVQFIFTSSEEDKNLLMNELKNSEEECSKQMRGFREVIDTISSAHRPVVASNCLQEFTYLHSKFIAPLPPSMAEFMCSLRLAFSNIIDLNYLWKEIGPLKKADNIWAASSYLKRQFFVPLTMEIPHEGEQMEVKDHGHNVVRITELFSRLLALLKTSPEDCHLPDGSVMGNYSNNFHSSCSDQETESEEVHLVKNAKKISTENLLFFWGFRSGISARELKCKLCEAYSDLFADFELRLVDKTCAAIVFWRSGTAQALLEVMNSGRSNVAALEDMISGGLKAAGYEAYRRVFDLGIPDANLADCLDKVLLEPNCNLLNGSPRVATEIYWKNDSVIRLEEL